MHTLIFTLIGAVAGAGLGWLINGTLKRYEARILAGVETRIDSFYMEIKTGLRAEINRTNDAINGHLAKVKADAEAEIAKAKAALPQGFVVEPKAPAVPDPNAPAPIPAAPVVAEPVQAPTAQA